jgi:hypothetical protein
MRQSFGPTATSGAQFDETKSHAYSDNHTLACFGKQGALDNGHYSVIVVGS